FGRRLAARSFGFTRRGEAAPRSSSFVVACRCGSSFGRRLAARSFGFTRRGEAAPRSSSFVVRLALLAERLHAFFEVVRREEAADRLMLEQHRVRERHAGALHGGKLYLTLREGRTAAIHRPPLLSLGVELPRRHDDAYD